MLQNMSLNDSVILIDFDGTITTEDTNDKLAVEFSNPEVEQFQRENNEREMTYVEYMDNLFSKLKMTEEEYLDFILNEIELTQGFIEFHEKIKKANIHCAIISGGFSNGILPLLNKYGIDDIEVRANKLNFDGKDLSLEFYHNRNPKCCTIGLCGNCKTKHINEFRERYKNIIFIGDGITDEPVASKADIVFAKDTLLDYCNENNLNCLVWDDFFDIDSILKLGN